MKIIEKIRLKNFKRFPSFEITFTNELNLLIGENETGKSSLLTAIELVLSGSRAKVEGHGLENLLSQQAVSEFFSGSREQSTLPILCIELFLNEQDNPSLDGRVNMQGVQANGLRLLCEPNQDLSREIQQVLEQQTDNFPFEHYAIRFMTFAGEAYSGYSKYLRYLLLDSSQINSDYATRDYINTLYQSLVTSPEQVGLKNAYRMQKDDFARGNLAALNEHIKPYQFTIRSDSRSNLETDLSLMEDGISIDNRGKGHQCFIKTAFALRRYGQEASLDTLLLEEPENHLSHANMNKLISKIVTSHTKQLFIATHNSLISTRLNLRNAILLTKGSDQAITLRDLPADTARFFMKAPDNNLLEFILAEKTILVEGDAEYILMAAFFEQVTGQSLANAGVQVISVNGTSFKRYLDLALLLGMRTAVIRDNDGNGQKNCTENYHDYTTGNISIFFDGNDKLSTFEISLYAANQKVCEEAFGPGRRTLSVQEYMLANKADCAFTLLEQCSKALTPPDYIIQAVRWIIA